MKTVTDQTNYINVELGGIGTLLAEKDKWDRKEVTGYILPMLEAVAETIASFRQALEAAFEVKPGEVLSALADVQDVAAALGLAVEAGAGALSPDALTTVLDAVDRALRLLRGAARAAAAPAGEGGPPGPA